MADWWEDHGKPIVGFIVIMAIVNLIGWFLSVTPLGEALVKEGPPGRTLCDPSWDC